MSATPNLARVTIARLGFGLIAAQVVAIIACWFLTRDLSPSRAILISAGAIILLTAIWLIIVVRLLRRDQRRLRENIKWTIDQPFTSMPSFSTGEFAETAASLSTALLEVNRRVDRLNARLGQQRIIHQSMSTGMISLDPDLRVASINRAAEHMFGLHESTAVRRPLREILHEPELNQLITQAMREGNSANAEITLHGHGRPTVHVIIEPLRGGASGEGNGEGNGGDAYAAPPTQSGAGLLLLIQDITRQRRLETMRSDFAANVSHELRTPITNIKGYVETLIETGAGNPEQTAQFLSVIKRNSDRLGAIIEDLLALARIEQTPYAGALVRESMPLRPVIESAILHHDEASRAKNISIKLEADPDLAAPIDAQLLEQAISNLFSNAVKYSPASSKITVRCDQKGDHVAISVTDEGPGISGEHLPRLFERFYRVDRARSREMGGTGLGLAIVKHIAQAHGGRAEVSSALRRGSTFRIILPLD